MFGQNHKTDLEALRRRLQAWQQTVPSRAERFHDVLADLDRRIAQRLTGWWPFRNEDELERFRDRVDRLDSVARDLSDLIQRTDALETEARKLQEQVSERDEAALSDWLQQRGKTWSIDLQRLWINCDRHAELMRDESVLNRLEAEIRLHDEAIYWYRQATEILKTLDTDMRAVGLKGALPGLENRLFSDGASNVWIQELKGLVQPLRELAGRPQPESLQTVPGRLSDVRGWAKELGEYGDEFHQLDQRHKRIVLDWRNLDDLEIQSLVDEVERLRQRLLDHGHKIRRHRFQELEDQMRALFQICGPQPELEGRLKTLGQGMLERHQLHRKWLEKLGGVEENFKAIVQTQGIALEERRDRRVEVLKADLKGLQEGPLSKAVLEQAEEMAHEVKELEERVGAEALLAGLRHSEPFQARLEQLKRDAEKDDEDLRRTRETLLARQRALQTEAAKVDMETPELEDQISRLMEASASGPTLEAAQKLAADLNREVEAAEQQFLARGEKRLGKDLDELQAAVRTLAEIDEPAPLADLPSIPAAAEPAEVTAALNRGQELLGWAAERLNAVAEKLEQRQVAVSNKLSSLRLDLLGPGDREDGAQLIRELTESAWIQEQDLLKYLSQLAQLVEKCDLFFARLRREQDNAEQHLKTSRDRLRRFEDDHLKKYCPELTERVTALIFGLLEHRPRRLSAFKSQLKMAEEILDQLAVQARRLAAKELRDAIDVLRDRSRDATAPAAARSGELLALIERHGHDTLAPVALRMQLLTEARREA